MRQADEVQVCDVSNQGTNVAPEIRTSLETDACHLGNSEESKKLQPVNDRKVLTCRAFESPKKIRFVMDNEARKFANTNSARNTDSTAAKTARLTELTAEQKSTDTPLPSFDEIQDELGRSQLKEA